MKSYVLTILSGPPGPEAKIVSSRLMKEVPEEAEVTGPFYIIIGVKTAETPLSPEVLDHIRKIIQPMGNLKAVENFTLAFCQE